MTLLISIIAVVALISLYDYFSNRTWNQVTSDHRNDIVFEHRNQAYGAYRIRRDYNRRILFILAGFTAGIGGLYAASLGLRDSGKGDLVCLDCDIVNIPLPDERPPLDIQPKLPETTPPPATQDMVKNPEPEPSDDPVVPPPTIIKDGENGGPFTVKGTGDEWDPIVPIPGKGKDGKPTIIEIKDEEPVYADEPAEYIGDRPAMVAFMGKNLNYPDRAVEERLEGRVFTLFVVSKEGDISDVKVQRGMAGCPECDKEAVRVINKMPRWKPGRKNGRAVASYFNLPIYFKLAN